MDKMLHNRKAIVFFVAPAFILFTVVLLIPILQMLYYSLCDYNALKEPVFIGLDNFKTLLFEDKTMRTALKNSLFFMIFFRGYTAGDRSSPGRYADKYKAGEEISSEM